MRLVIEYIIMLILVFTLCLGGMYFFIIPSCSDIPFDAKDGVWCRE